MAELEKVFGKEKVTPPQPSEVKPQGEKKPEVSEAEAKKQEQLKNLDKAIIEAQGELVRIRTAKKDAKPAPVVEEVPKIDFEDPSAKAWGRHIAGQVDPIVEEIEREKTERREFVLRQFLTGKPALARDPEKVKRLIQTYDRIKNSTERTNEGIATDLNRAFAAEFHEELLARAQTTRMGKVEDDVLFSDIAVSRGATSYSSQSESTPELSSEDDKILERWGFSSEEKQLVRKADAARSKK